MKKKPSIPKLFKKAYTEKKLKKNILKRIHIPKDRDMIRALFIPDEKGKYILNPEIPEESLQRLPALAKSIKKNKGALSTWKVAILLTIIAPVVVFNYFFKDRVVKNVLEKGLEAAFGAEATIEDPELSLFKGLFSYQSLQIADAGDLTRNLVETGPAVFKINMAELTRKRVHIEETSLSGFQWDTERDSSAAEKIPATEEENSEDSSSEEGESFLDTLALSPEEMDYKALLENQKENLKSLNLINQGNEEIEAFKEKWTAQFELKQQEIAQLTEKVKSFQSMDIKNIRSIDEGKEAVEKIKSFYPRVEETGESLKTLQADFQEEKEQLSNLYGDISNVLEEDISYLTGLMDFSSGNIRSLASGAAEQYIRRRWDSYFEKGLKALDVYEKFRSGQSDSSEEKKGLTRGGRTIPFPSPDLPDVLVKQISLSGGTEETGKLETEILSLTDDPDKLGAPSTFQASWIGVDSSLNLEGLFDSRSDAEQTFDMTILSPENTLMMEDGIPALQITRIEGEASINGKSYTQADQDGVMTDLKILLSSLQFEQASQEGFLAEAVSDIMRGLDQVELDTEILVSREGIEEIHVSTDLDAILADGIGDYLKNMGEEAEEQLREYLESYLTPYLEDNALLQDAMDALGADSLEQLASVENLQNILNDKKEELSGKTTAILEEAERLKAETEQRAREEAGKLKAEAERQKAEAEQKAREEAARLQAEADRQKAEAERRAQEEAEKAAQEAANKLNLPRF